MRPDRAIPGDGSYDKNRQQGPREAVLVFPGVGEGHTYSVLQQLLLRICHKAKNKVHKIRGLSRPGRRIQTNFQMSSGPQNFRSPFFQCFLLLCTPQSCFTLKATWIVRDTGSTWSRCLHA